VRADENAAHPRQALRGARWRIVARSSGAPLSIVDRSGAASLFQRGSSAFDLQSATNARPWWLCRLALFGRSSGLANEFDKSIQSVSAIGVLRPESPRRNNDDSTVRDTTAGEPEEAAVNGVGQRRRLARVKAQLDGGRYSVDVLPARAGGADERFAKLLLANRDGIGNPDHCRAFEDHLSPACAACAARGRERVLTTRRTLTERVKRDEASIAAEAPRTWSARRSQEAS